MRLLKEGQTIRSTYEVERFLGEGAFAEVYRVRHQFLGRQAMKVFKKVGVDQPEILKMMEEAILLSRIGHPNIIRVYDANIFDTANGQCGYFTMENVSGGSLDKFWRSHGNQLISLDTALDLIKQVCRGLAVAHEADPPIIHRDIKPHNILIGYQNDGLRARLSDFGLAKSVNPLTLLASAAGTLQFKAPETFEKKRSDSCAGDIWGVGVTLYLLLTDMLPYEMSSDHLWENKKVFLQAAECPSKFNVQIDGVLDEIIMRCLQVNPDDRYRNARELLTALEGWKKPTRTPGKSKSQISASLGKSVLGQNSPLDEGDGYRLASEALRISKDSRKLFEAADMMEEAFNKVPALREKHAARVRLWRSGVSM